MGISMALSEAREMQVRRRGFAGDTPGCRLPTTANLPSDKSGEAVGIRWGYSEAALLRASEASGSWTPYKER